MTDTKHLDEAAQMIGYKSYAILQSIYPESVSLLPHSCRQLADTLAKLEAKTAEFEAFRLEVSEAVKQVDDTWEYGQGRREVMAILAHFIIEKPDPLVEALACLVPLTPTPHSGETHAQAMARELRSELARHGLAIVEAP